MVVSVGVTCVAPEPSTIPNPLSMDADDPPADFQESVEDSPLWMTYGVAVKYVITGVSSVGRLPETVTVVVASMEPCSLFAVSL